jgi:hypothetical protein
VIGYVLGRSRRLVHVEPVGRLGESFGVLRRVLNVAVAKAYHVLLSALCWATRITRVWTAGDDAAAVFADVLSVAVRTSAKATAGRNEGPASASLVAKPPA